jgi:hypothetical protein
MNPAVGCEDGTAGQILECRLPAPVTEGEKQTQALLAGDMREFCASNVYEGVGSLAFQWTPEKSRKNRKARYIPSDETPWMISALGTEEGAMAASEHPSCFGNRFDVDKSQRQKALNTLSNPPNFTWGSPQEIRRRGQELLSSKSEDFGLKILTAVAASACQDLQPQGTDPVPCQRAFASIRGIMTQREDLTLIPTTLEVLTNSKYADGLRKAALKISDRADRGGAPSGSFFGDIRDSFLQSGISPAEATEMTWNVMGVLATGGPNLINRLHRYIGGWPLDPIELALSTIACTLPLLDARSAGTHLYSYPENIQTTCSSAKPYHFWMSAFLARTLVRQGYAPDTATASTYIMQKFYQAFSDSGSRKPTRAFTVDTFDAFNNVMRMDLSYAAAGAQFGARSANGAFQGHLDVDAGIRVSIQNSKAHSPCSPTWAKIQMYMPYAFYREWTGMFGADDVYRFHQNVAKSP